MHYYLGWQAARSIFKWTHVFLGLTIYCLKTINFLHFCKLGQAFMHSTLILLLPEHVGNLKPITFPKLFN